ncbi:uncharacterized protein N7498_008985 [Penicillium cinerascens]|uniref:Major facilitator superfamily transporter n=1 Tax=Penicillium cinerascens TaxID=70096 RepID=A0A9W9MCT1_9EURO|nr:uncharacterized protein N7498_008985 [Penicillium cinerascens]KAJ5195547.1 hypothetical protein N7498_008985 [Penicillium cinerascens]
MGSHNLLHLRDDICFDRYGRYGPYGLGYSIEEGGTGEGMSHRLDPRVADVWKKTGLIDYRDIDWGEAQHRCYESNQQHFVAGNGTIESRKKKRQAVVIRTYTGFFWTQYAKLNIRALISETALKSGGEYAVHLLLHVKDDDIPIWADAVARQSVLDEHVPKEFHSICTLWSEAQMRLYYPGDFGVSVENPSDGDIHSVHRSAHMPLQHFAVHHPEYAHFWNWELDIRYIGSYYELFSKLGDWTARQPRTGAWERSARYYIPALHGSWEAFTENIQRNLRTSGRQPIMGPIEFDREEQVNCVMEEYLAESCKGDANVSLCGVDEPADLITLNPLFDVEDSGWVFSKDITGYDVRYSLPPRRSTLVTASRLSWRLLDTMHQETWKMHHSMFTEMFPQTVALHYGLKAVFAPHPVYLERSWPLETVDKVFNGGKDHTAGGPGSPFSFANEHNFKGTTWYYHAEFAGRLWRRWLSERKEGDVEDEKHADTEGQSRLCLRSMLFHPIKWE